MGISEIGSPSESICPTLSGLLASSDNVTTSHRFASREKFRPLFRVSPPITRFLNVCVGRKLNTKDRRIRRIPLCSPAYSFRPLCAPFMRPYDYKGPRSSCVLTKSNYHEERANTDEIYKFNS